MSIFGQVWLWSLVAFVVGVLLSWVFLARPAQARNRVLERQLLDAKNAPAPERQPLPTRTFDREQEAASNARSFDGGVAAANQVAPETERGDGMARTGWYERDSFSGTASGPGGGSFSAVLDPDSDPERTTYFSAAPQSDAGSLLGGTADAGRTTRFEDQYGNAAAAGFDDAPRFESDSAYGGDLIQGGVLGGSSDVSGDRSGEERSFGGDFAERQGQRFDERSNVDSGSLFDAGDARAPQVADDSDDLVRRFAENPESHGFAGGLDVRGHEADDQSALRGQRADSGRESGGPHSLDGELGRRPRDDESTGQRFEPWRRTGEESLEERGRQGAAEEAGQWTADEQTGAHGRPALDERADVDSDAGQPEAGQSRHSISPQSSSPSGLDELPKRIPGGHRLHPDSSAVDGPGSLFDGGEQPESAAGSLFGGPSSARRGSLFEPSAPPEADDSDDPGSAPGAHAAGDAWSQPSSGVSGRVGGSAEQPPAYAFSKDVDPDDVVDEQAVEATTVLPKRQPRSTPRSSFEAPRPSMRSVERRESTVQGEERGRSGSLFEPTTQRNSGAGAPAASDFDAPVAATPPARSTPEPSSVPPGPFGPGSAMPRPGGAPPADDFAVKASVTALRYCTEESPQFARMVAEVWFRTAQDAERVGFRPLS